MHIVKTLQHWDNAGKRKTVVHGVLSRYLVNRTTMKIRRQAKILASSYLFESAKIKEAETKRLLAQATSERKGKKNQSREAKICRC